MEHLAKDGPAALGFYKGLAGHDSSVVTSEHGIGYNVLKRQRSRAGLMQIPPQLEVVQPNWLPYVRVEDPAVLVARKEAYQRQVKLYAEAWQTLTGGRVKEQLVSFLR